MSFFKVRSEIARRSRWFSVSRDFNPLDLIPLQAAVLGTPAVVRDLGHLDGPDCFGNFAALRDQDINLAQLGDDLLSRMLLPSQEHPPHGAKPYLREDHSPGGRPRPTHNDAGGAAAKAILVVMDLLDAKEMVCEISNHLLRRARSFDRRQREAAYLNMSNVFQFPPSRHAAARQIPREEFERLAELALDVVDRIVALLDEPDEKLQCAATHESRVVSLRGRSPISSEHETQP